MKAFLTSKILTNLTKINCPLVNLEFTLQKRNVQGKNIPEDTIWRSLAGHKLLGQSLHSK
jgi:hypothetical protein